MSKVDVEMDFPALSSLPYDLSDEDFNYNCLAYALGDTKNWWEPPLAFGQYWPPGFSPDITVVTVEQIIRLHGFTKEIKVGEVPTSDAVAIFAEGKEWTHFAKFKDGRWSSKLGEGHDVSNVDPQYLEGEIYGKVVKVLCRAQSN